MTEMQQLIKETIPTLLVGAVGAAIFWVVGFPAAVLTGSAAAVALFTIFGMRANVPPYLRDAIFLVIGVSIGSTVTPEVIAMALNWPLSFVVLTATLILVLLIVRAILMHGFGFDRTTAALAAAPGHFSYILSLSADLKADIPSIALVQSVRVFLLTLLVPVLIVLWGAEGTTQAIDTTVITLGAAALVFVCAVPLGLLMKRLRVPAPLLLGAMVASAIGHGTNLTPGTLPPWATTAAFIGMGCLIGTRFRGLGRAGLLVAVLAGVAATLVACAVAALGAGFATLFVDIPFAALLLAFAPGGVEVMAAIAVETALEPAFVAAHHVFRLIILSFLIPIVLTQTEKT